MTKAKQEEINRALEELYEKFSDLIQPVKVWGENKKYIYYSARPSSKHYKGFQRYFLTLPEVGIINITRLVAIATDHRRTKQGEMICQEMDCVILSLSEKLFGNSNVLQALDINY